jgi:hypothetical protein
MNNFLKEVEHFLVKMTGVMFIIALHLFSIGCVVAALKWITVLVG